MSHSFSFLFSTASEKPAGSERSNKPSKYAGQDLILGDDGLEIKAGTIDRLIERLFMDAGVNENTKVEDTETEIENERKSECLGTDSVCLSI